MNKKKEKLKVLGGKILIKKINQQRYGNLLLMDSAGDSYFRGVVSELGDEINTEGKKFIYSVKIGDEILFPKYKGYEIRLEEDNYVILPAEEVIAIIK